MIGLLTEQIITYFRIFLVKTLNYTKKAEAENFTSFILLFSSVSFLFALYCLLIFTLFSISFIHFSILVSIGIGISKSSKLNFSLKTHTFDNAFAPCSLNAFLPLQNLFFNFYILFLLVLLELLLHPYIFLIHYLNNFVIYLKSLL